MQSFRLSPVRNLRPLHDSHQTDVTPIFTFRRIARRSFVEKYHSAVGMCTYIDWIPTLPGPVKRFQTKLAALANSPVENF